MIPRLYTQYPISTTNSIPLTAPQHHYLSKVMRLKPDDVVHTFNGTQGLWRAKFNGMTLENPSPIMDQPPATKRICLFFSPIKQQNWLIEKGTEIGITDFFPILCHRTVVRHFCSIRHTKIIHEACEQSHRLIVPTLHPMQSLNETFLDKLCSAKDLTIAVLQLDAPTPLLHANPMPAGIILGPEGGWSPEENRLFATKPSIVPVHLGTAVLRAETAALVAGCTIIHMNTRSAPSIDQA